jgi:hypothetical protein
MSTDVCLDQRGSELTRSRPAFRVTSGDAFNPRTGTPGPNGWWSALRQTMLAVQLTSAMLALAFSAGATPQSAGRLTGITGKTYVITGASSGFGRGVALKFGAQGANVVLAARRTAVLNGVAAQVRAAGGTPLVVTTDVAKAGEVARLAHTAIARFGRINCWVNDAGVAVIRKGRGETRTTPANAKGRPGAVDRRDALPADASRPGRGRAAPVRG